MVRMQRRLGEHTWAVSLRPARSRAVKVPAVVATAGPLAGGPVTTSAKAPQWPLPCRLRHGALGVLAVEKVAGHPVEETRAAREEIETVVAVGVVSPSAR